MNDERTIFLAAFITLFIEFTTLFAAFSAWMHRMCGQTDLVIGARECGGFPRRGPIPNSQGFSPTTSVLTALTIEEFCAGAADQISPRPRSRPRVAIVREEVGLGGEPVLRFSINAYFSGAAPRSIGQRRLDSAEPYTHKMC